MNAVTSFFYSLLIQLVSLQDFLHRKLADRFRATSKTITDSILKKTDIQINGNRPWDMVVKDDKFYNFYTSDLGVYIGESYMWGWWDCKQLEELTCRVLERGELNQSLSWDAKLAFFLKYNVFNLQTKDRSVEVATKHYNLGNDMFQSFLDPTMSYSCGYWKNADTLEKAQLDKLNLIARKLALSPGMRVMDIGCGWGGLCKYLAENYDVEVVGYNISKEQVEYAREVCKNTKVEIRLADYREANEKFDRIVSVGMFEHVGPQNYRTYFEVANRCLTDDGIFLLHTIGVNHANHHKFGSWMEKYIFPNGVIPYYLDVMKASEGLFIVEDLHNFGFDYYKTLMEWWKNFDQSWPKMEEKYGNTFYRMWRFYLLTCAGIFKARRLQLWQIVYAKNGVKNGYVSCR